MFELNMNLYLIKKSIDKYHSIYLKLIIITLDEIFIYI